MSAEIQSWDDYYIPGTQIMRNNYFVSRERPYGVDNVAILRNYEEADTGRAMIALMAEPVAGSFDREHFLEIHRRIFRRTYPWAGEPRVGPEDGYQMAKRGPAIGGLRPSPEVGEPGYDGGRVYLYARHADMETVAEAGFVSIEHYDRLRGLDPDTFADRLGEVWARVNAAHLAREGNTRAQAVFFDQLAHQAGYDLDTTRFAIGGDLREIFVDARNYYLARRSHEQLSDVLAEVITPIGLSTSGATHAARAARLKASMDLNNRGWDNPGPAILPRQPKF